MAGNDFLFLFQYSATLLPIQEFDILLFSLGLPPTYITGSKGNWAIIHTLSLRWGQVKMPYGGSYKIRQICIDLSTTWVVVSRYWLLFLQALTTTEECENESNHFNCLEAIYWGISNGMCHFKSPKKTASDKWNFSSHVCFAPCVLCFWWFW